MLEQLGAGEQPPVPHSAFRLVIQFPEGSATLTQYTSGKLLVQGNISAESGKEIEAIISQCLDSQTQAGISTPCIGMDESGKGDYFGPLVLAAVRLAPDSCRRLEREGVADSKTLDDQRIPDLSEEIRQESGGHYIVRVINPEEYNPLYEKFRSEKKNLNSLLGWSYAHILEDLLKRAPTPVAIVDKFGPPRHVTDWLGDLSHDIDLRFETGAERHVPVAAASILAREAFLQQMKALSPKVGFELPKGASHGIIDAGRRIVQTHGKDVLAQVAKLHFKTTTQILHEQLELG